ncbi:MAG: rhodanese-like domain-containing protein [Bacteroidia bacterium]|nr:rhodanese-like domain-containing protein [Bacteroidia bacterium]
MKKIFFTLVGILSINSIVTAQSVVTNLPTERFKAIIESDKAGVIIDLRTPDEIAKGYIKDAVFIDYLSKDFEKEIAKLDKSKTYYVYCAAGGRSADAAAHMEKIGFKRVYNLEKGFSDWKKKELPIEKK